jgi:CheY-like chemotaxis protein
MLILLDIQLPLMDGYAVARELRNNAALRDIPIIAVTKNHRRRMQWFCGKTGQSRRNIDEDWAVSAAKQGRRTT